MLVAEPIIEIRNIRKSFGGLVAVNDVSFDVQEGEVLGLMGPNGAGKTTLLNVLSGGYTPDKGSIRFRGIEIGGMPPYRLCRMGMSRTYQIPQPFTSLTAHQNVMVAALYGQPHISRKAAAEYADILFELLSCPCQKMLCSELTVLTLKKVELMRALASNPAVVLLDEVAAGSTDVELPQILTIIQKIREMGKTIIMVEHIMKLMVEAVDRIVVIDKGSKLAEGTPAEIMKHPGVIEAYLG